MGRLTGPPIRTLNSTHAISWTCTAQAGEKASERANVVRSGSQDYARFQGSYYENI